MMIVIVNEARRAVQGKENEYDYTDDHCQINCSHEGETIFLGLI
jgi:hypothetical protein